MKIIQTFWTGGYSPEEDIVNFSAGWSSPEYHWMSWALSCLLLRRLYTDVALYTDQRGKEILIDKLRLPYTQVHILFDEDFQIDSRLFTLSKIKTYCAQTGPFLHVDGDLFVWNRFPAALESAGVVASNLERDLFFNKDILLETEDHFDVVPEHLRGVAHHETIYSSNAGIFGGNNLGFIKRYGAEAVRCIADNKASLSAVNTKSLNFLIEQISLYYLAKAHDVAITYYVAEPVVHPLYQDYLRFADAPAVNMVHAVGGCKRTPFVLDHLAQRLRLEFPTAYYTVLQLCKDHGVPLRNKLYQYVDIGGHDVLQKLVAPEVFLKRFHREAIDALSLSFEKRFIRTLLHLEKELRMRPASEEQLMDILQSPNVSADVREIAALESMHQALREKSANALQAGELYHACYIRYTQATTFYHESNSFVFHIHPLASLLKVQKNWTPLPEDETPIEEEQDQKNEWIVALTFNVLTLAVEESYCDDLDGLLLTCMANGKSFHELLSELLPYFDDDVRVEDIAFRQLIGDTIKRLIFAGVLSLE